MVEILLPSGSPPECRERLERAGVQVRICLQEMLPALDGGTVDQVILIPAAIFASARWPRLRVELARGARFFVVEVTEPGTAAVVAAMRDGACDVVADGESDERWRSALELAAESQRVWLQLYAGSLDLEGARLVGRSAVMLDLRRDLERLGPTDVTVLLLGESGVGKERVCAALHEAGRGGPLVTLNCAAMPRDLIEAELFGAERGSFTGAVRSRPGLVEQADGGTLFLDEVGELDPTVQPKLLRFLETRRARRVGGESEYAVRVRVVAATNRDLEGGVRDGGFRADLYYRLAEVVIRIPPLRSRKEDIPDLVRSFVAAANERFGKNVGTIEPDLLLRLQQYAWPGNIRELKGVVDRLVLFHDGPVLRSGWWEPPSARTATLPSHPPELSLPEGDAVSGQAPGPGSSEPALHRDSSGASSSRPDPDGSAAAMPAAFPGRAARLEMARRLLEGGQLSLGEVASRVGIHPTTLFRWRKAGKAGAAGGAAGGGNS